MKTTKLLSLFAAAVIASSSAIFAASVSDYQVTGQVTEVNDSIIAVMKGKEKFEIARDSNTKVNSDVKVGDKVTVHYKMTATTVDGKAAKADAKKK